MKEIEMLCWYDKVGTPHPIRFRFSNEEGYNQVVKIDAVKVRESERLAANKMIRFICLSKINGSQYELLIKYELETCKWYLM